jgi:hypothetical protein
MPRLLAQRTQWLIVGGVALGLGGIFGTASGLNWLMTESSSADAVEPAAPPGTFRLTEAQWRG